MLEPGWPSSGQEPRPCLVGEEKGGGGVVTAFSSSDSRNTMKHDVIGGGKFKYMKEMSKTY